MEDLAEIWTFISQVEADTNDILMGLEIIEESIRDIDVEDESNFEVSEKQIKVMLDRCEDMSERVSLLDDSINELKDSIEKLKKLRVVLALQDKEQEN